MFDAAKFFSQKPLIGMLHLAALPGSPLASAPLASIRERTLADAKALVDGGCHALMMENFGDVPFTAGRVAAETIAAVCLFASDYRLA